MTEHLPIQQYGARGPLSDPPILGEYIMVTYDDHLAALRACEERVLDAARNALAALRGYFGTDGNGDGTVWVEKINALSVIDALREGDQP